MFWFLTFVVLLVVSAIGVIVSINTEDGTVAYRIGTFMVLPALILTAVVFFLLYVVDAWIDRKGFWSPVSIALGEVRDVFTEWWEEVANKAE